MMIRAMGAVLLGAGLAACGRSAEPPPSTDVRVAPVASLPDTPDAKAWDKAPPYQAALRPQDMVDPRKMTTGTTTLRVRALHDGRSIALRLRWEDATIDDVRIPSTFGDACAVQFPAGTGPDLPAPQMGEPGKPVEIVYWSAAAQKAQAAGSDDIRTLYPNAKIDHYPFEAESLKNNPAAQKKMALEYAPARALGNGPPAPVQDLMAQGPGTLRPDPRGSSEGVGKRSKAGWSVHLRRRLPKSLDSGNRSHVSFAIWDGTAGDAGSKKMWTPWIALILEDREPAP